MPNNVVGFKINGTTYEYDHEHLANLPTIDAEPTEDSTNAVQSGGVYSAVKKLDDFVKAGLSIVKVNLKSLMTDHDKVYLYTGSEPNESTGYWYYWNGTQFVPGGLYGAGVQIDAVPTQGSTNAVSSGGVYDEISCLKEDLNDISDKTGVVSDITNSIVLNDGRRIGVANGVSSTTIYPFSDTGFISCEGYDTLNISMPIALGAYAFGLAFYTTYSEASFIANSGVAVHYDTSLSEMSSEIRTISIPSTAKYFRTTWIKSTDASYQSNTFSCTLTKTGTLEDEIANVEGDFASIEITVSGNALDPVNLLTGYEINRYGVTSENASYATTDFIPVDTGDVVICGTDKETSITIARIVTYDADKNVVDGTTTSVASYTVPSGVFYVRICANNAYFSRDTSRVNLGGELKQYEDYYSGKVNRIGRKNGTDIFNILNYPLSTLPSYIVKNIAYKALGTLSKGYICLTTDDGDADVATYTIPMCIEKDVPCTFAMMSDSDVLQTAEGLATVQDAVENHGFCIAQHGGQVWTNYDEYGLNKFFDDEAEYWESIGIDVYGACCPQIQFNDWIGAMAGGRFGCHRAAYQYGVPYYSGYINGPRSNLYALTSQNIIDGTLADWKAKCDTTLANNWLLFIHTHENELDADDKTKFEAVIDYAKSIGLEFITMKDIPSII